MEQSLYDPFDPCGQTAAQTGCVCRARHCLQKFFPQLVFVLAVLVVLTIFGGMSAARHYYREMLLNEVQANTEKSAQMVALMLAREREQFELFVGQFQQFLRQRPGNRQIVALLKKTPFRLQYQTLGVVLSNGQVITSAGGEGGSIGEQGYRQIQTRQHFILSGWGNAGQNEKRQFQNVICSPLDDAQGNQKGVIFAVLDNRDYRTALANPSIEEYVSSLILDENGQPVAPLPPLFYPRAVFNGVTMDVPEASRIGRQIIDGVKKEVQQGKLSGRFVYQAVGTHYVSFSAMSVVPGAAPWLIIDTLSNEKFIPQVQQVKQTLFAMVALVVLLTATASAVLFYGLRLRRREQLRDLGRMASVDAVTGGRNVYAFNKTLQEQKHPGYVVITDIVQFKVIRSVCGHLRSNEILRILSSKIEAWMQPGDFSGHIFADQFIVYLATDSKTLVTQRLEQLSLSLAQLHEEFDIPKIKPYFGATLWYPGMYGETAYDEASRAKTHGAFVSFFSEADARRSALEKEMEDSFEGALQRHEFEIWYQPKFNAQTRVINGAEALVRWRWKNNELVPPMQFIPFFESTGLICQLDEYMFREVCSHQRMRLDRGLDIVPVSVNLSRKSLYRTGVAEIYWGLLQEYGLDANSIALEITESTALGNEEIKEIFNQFYDLGFDVHLDDFGRENSSLSALNCLHFDTLKLDKKLVDYVGTFRGYQILRYTITLCKKLGLHVTAEGVESEEQLEDLRRLGCDTIQGAVFCLALPKETFWERLDMGRQQTAK